MASLQGFLVTRLRQAANVSYNSMDDSPYNKLPPAIKRKYKIVYSELIFDTITMFKDTSEKWGVLKMVKKMGLFSTYECLIEPIFNSTGFDEHLELIQVVKYENDKWDKDKNIFFYFDIKGSLKWQSEKGESVRTDKFKNVFLCRNGKIGLLDKNFNQLIAPKYERLNAINDKFFKAFHNERFGIINGEDELILEFAFADIFNVSKNNKVIVKAEDGNYFSFDFYIRAVSNLPFNKILNASSNTCKAPVQESSDLFKSVVDVEENPEFDEYDYEMVRYKGKWGVIDGAGEVLIPNTYSYVDFLRNPKYFKVGIGEMEVTEFRDDEKRHRTSVRNVKWGIVDIKNNVIVPIQYDWIDEVESTIWVVYKGGTVFYNDDYQEDYWAHEGGKLGVYNLAKLIVPIEYDTISKSWFRIKDYVFVQKGIKYFDEKITNYDVFTLDGKKIEDNKPNPKNHYNNG
jgi:hypothetical protein